MPRPGVLFLSLILFQLPMGGVFAADFSCKDADWASDHAEVPRYADACLIGSTHVGFDAFELQLGKIVRNPDGRGFTAEQTRMVEGAHTRLLYLVPPGPSMLGLVRSYQKALEDRGYKVLYLCREGECSQVSSTLLDKLGWPKERPIPAPSPREEIVMNRAFLGTNTQNLLVAENADQSIQVSIFIGRASTAVPSIRGGTLALIDVVESGELEVRMIDAEAMDNALTETGRITLENIHFETGSARLTANSDPALQEMARLLAEKAELNVYIVGHTDNVGTVENNLALSRNRAAAVVTALETRFGAVAGRAVAAGVASYAPLASNATEAGRALNRRVELVLR
ncbi:hypothetical protein CWI75_03770 [Kineobactrum sediminis]|uniref:OmpA-like domain-containing protein n=1 Tax=Kineobactrum sediminis TaxID=1905677 RepID=A0A2N5Y511_9GAMM|nr:OmpA family protein [Kineobactrum sediminis]PLW83484.1 hypothetical protein CWI75_03770 [Kineobactrum sediminis]